MGKALAVSIVAVAAVNTFLMPTGSLRTFIGWACIFGCSLITGWYAYRSKSN